MRYLPQFAIIMTVSFLGELLQRVLPLPVPGSIYALLLMLGGLLTGVIPLEKVRDAGRFLLDIMPLFFIPATVGVMEVWESHRGVLLPALVITLVSTAVVMGVTGRSVQGLMKREGRTQKRPPEAGGGDGGVSGGKEDGGKS